MLAVCNNSSLFPKKLTFMISSWPFVECGINITGSLPIGTGRVKYTVVMVDYLTKWTDAKPLNTITTKRLV